MFAITLQQGHLPKHLDESKAWIGIQMTRNASSTMNSASLGCVKKRYITMSYGLLHCLSLCLFNRLVRLVKHLVQFMSPNLLSMGDLNLQCPLNATDCERKTPFISDNVLSTVFFSEWAVVLIFLWYVITHHRGVFILRKEEGTKSYRGPKKENTLVPLADKVITWVCENCVISSYWLLSLAKMSLPKRGGRISE